MPFEVQRYAFLGNSKCTNTPGLTHLALCSADGQTKSIPALIVVSKSHTIKHNPSPHRTRPKFIAPPFKSSCSLQPGKSSTSFPSHLLRPHPLVYSFKRCTKSPGFSLTSERSSRRLLPGTSSAVSGGF